MSGGESKTQVASSTSRVPRLTEDEILHSPSFYDGIGREVERRYQIETQKWISKTGESLKMDQQAIATASAYFYRFYSKYSYKEHDRRVVACGCLFLSSKTQECRNKLDNIVDHYNYILYQHIQKKPMRPKKDSKVFKDFREKVIQIEALIMEALEFNFYQPLPYDRLVVYLQKLFPGPDGKKVLSGTRGVAQLAWYFVNDSFRSTLCLTHKEDHIALAAINLAMRMKKINYEKEWGGKTPWHEKFGISTKILEEIGTRILDAYPHASMKSKLKMSKKNHEKYMKLSDEEKKHFRKQLRLEGMMSSDEKARYAKMTPEQKKQFLEKIKREEASRMRLKSQKHSSSQSSHHHAGKLVSRQAGNQSSRKSAERRSPRKDSDVPSSAAASVGKSNHQRPDPGKNESAPASKTSSSPSNTSSKPSKLPPNSKPEVTNALKSNQLDKKSSENKVSEQGTTHPADQASHEENSTQINGNKTESLKRPADSTAKVDEESSRKKMKTEVAP